MLERYEINPCLKSEEWEPDTPPQLESTPLNVPFDFSVSKENASSIINHRGSTGEWAIGKNQFGKLKTTNVLSSEKYLEKEDQQGNITAYFKQFREGYTGEGIYQPNEKTYSNGPETISVLKVHWDSRSGSVNAQYLEPRNLRYALDDYRRIKSRLQKQPENTPDQILVNGEPATIEKRSQFKTFTNEFDLAAED